MRDTKQLPDVCRHPGAARPRHRPDGPAARIVV